MARNTAAMQRRRMDPSAHWTRTSEFKSSTGRYLTPGVEFSVWGERGRFRFQEHVVSGKGEWVSAIGGPSKVHMWRAFRPEKIRKVFVKRQLLTDAEARELVNEKNRLKREAA